MLICTIDASNETETKHIEDETVDGAADVNVNTKRQLDKRTYFSLITQLSKPASLLYGNDGGFLVKH